MNFTIKQPKRKDVKPGLPLVFIDSIHFLINSLENLFKNVKENDFYRLSYEFNANVIDLDKKRFFSMATGIALKNLRNVYLEKINFIAH